MPWVEIRLRQRSSKERWEVCRRLNPATSSSSWAIRTSSAAAGAKIDAQGRVCASNTPPQVITMQDAARRGHHAQARFLIVRMVQKLAKGRRRRRPSPPPATPGLGRRRRAHAQPLAGADRPGLAVSSLRQGCRDVVRRPGPTCSPSPAISTSYAVMASMYVKAVRGWTIPTVGILTSAPRRKKALRWSRKWRELIQKDPPSAYAGYVEAVICPGIPATWSSPTGFTGNVVSGRRGWSEMIFHTLQKESRRRKVPTPPLTQAGLRPHDEALRPRGIRRRALCWACRASS